MFSTIQLLRPTKIAIVALIGSLSISAVIGITIILEGEFSGTDVRILSTAASVAILAVLSLPSLFHQEHARYIYFASIGIISTLLFLIMLVITIWSGTLVDGDTYWKAFVTSGTIAFSTNHALLILIAKPLQTVILICQRITVLVIAVLGLLLLLALWTEDLPDPGIRLFATLAVVDALGTITVPLLVRITRAH